jgi:hypothetical protein
MKTKSPNRTLEDTSYGDVWGRLPMPGRNLQAFFHAHGIGSIGRKVVTLTACPWVNCIFHAKTVSDSTGKRIRIPQQSG